MLEAESETGRRGRIASILDRLGQQIIGGVPQPGQQLPPEASLMAQFGASRSVIREAVKTLAAKGIVRVGPRTGTIVNDPGQWSILDRTVLGWMMATGTHTHLFAAIDEVRYILEPQAAALAAERATPQLIDKLQTAYTAMVEAAVAEDTSAAIIADRAFHLAVLDATGNPILRAFDSAIDAILGTLFFGAVDHIDSFRQNLPRHRDVLEGIASHRPSEAAFAMQRLIAFTRENMRSNGLYDTGGNNEQSVLQGYGGHDAQAGAVRDRGEGSTGR